MYRLIPWCIALLSTGILLAESPNVVVVILDGATHETVHALRQKNRLTTPQTLTHYKPLSADPFTDHATAYASLLDPALWAHIHTHDPDRITGLLLSTPPGTPTLTTKPVSANWVAPEAPRSVYPVVQAATEFITQHADSPFLLVFNVTDIEATGRRTRAGAQAYSDTISRCDQALTALFTTLKSLDRSTQILVTASFGFAPNTRNALGTTTTWLASTQPMPIIRHAADLPDALIATLGLPPRRVASPPEPTDCCDNSNL
tara:strand:- start:698 stop:1477 length:780 start_codon:yes stop_codon:yes gene_type:complete